MLPMTRPVCSETMSPAGQTHAQNQELQVAGLPHPLHTTLTRGPRS